MRNAGFSRFGVFGLGTKAVPDNCDPQTIKGANLYRQRMPEASEASPARAHTRRKLLFCDL